MNRTLITGAVLASLLLGACATAPSPPQELVEARTTVRTAELDPAVLQQAPLELKKATDSLNRANTLLQKGESMADVASVAYVARQQAQTAIAVAQAKTNDAAIASADVERERARADIRAAEARRAVAQANVAKAQAGAATTQAEMARQQAATANQRASGAEAQAAAAQASASTVMAQNAELQRQLSELQAQQTERGMVVTLGDVLFEFGRADVKPGAEASLRKLSDFLQKNPARRILIEGHTDSVGSAEANNILSQRRAQAVANALQRMGVASDRIGTVGYGKDYPIADNNTDTNRALNRRVEVYIGDNEQSVRPRR
jgi:outer membrane protein OmpA-like peptidoglycan-associated protein